MPEDAIVKDPTKKRFWTLKNIGGLVLVALLPVAGTWAWDSASGAMKTLRDLDVRIKSLEEEKANNKAIWDAIAENKNEAARQREDLRVMQRLFDREFNRSTAPKAAEPPRWEEPKPAPMDPEKLRTIMEQKYPSKK